jgi:FkbM family methyltransferase
MTDRADLHRFLDHAAKYINLDEVKTFLDIGSRDGAVALAAKERLPQAEVWAFECNPEAVEICRKRLENTGVWFAPMGVSDQHGAVDFYAIDPKQTQTTHADGNIGASSFFQANPDYPHEKYIQKLVSVFVAPLADWATCSKDERCKKVESLDLLWLDIQGAELKALRGAGDLLQTAKCIYLEVAFKPVYLGQPLYPEVAAFLAQAGFVEVAQFDTTEWFGNAVFVRKDLVEKANERRFIAPDCSRDGLPAWYVDLLAGKCPPVAGTATERPHQAQAEGSAAAAPEHQVPEAEAVTCPHGLPDAICGQCFPDAPPLPRLYVHAEEQPTADDILAIAGEYLTKPPDADVVVTTTQPFTEGSFR